MRHSQAHLIAFDRTGRTVSVATLLAMGGAAGPAWSQVISVQPSGPLDTGAYVASSRMQYGLTQPSTYQGAILGGGRIASAQQAAVVAAGGFTASTNPPFWSQAGSPGNRFTLQYVAATNTLSLTVLSPGGGVVNFSIADTQDLSAARGMNINWTALLGSTFGNLALTSAGQTIALGPAGGVWSSSALANSTLSGWNLGADWTLTGRAFMQAGQDAAPALQMDILDQGLGYQLSGPGILNYGILQDLVITDTEFQQAAFGGTDGVIDADIQSKGAVTFDVAGTVTYRGDIADLTSVLVDPSARGAASLVKEGAGRLNLQGTASFTGTTTIEDGTLGITDDAQLGSAGLVFGDGSGVGSPALSLDNASGAMSYGLAVQLAAGADASVVTGLTSQDVAWSASITGAVGTSLTFRGLTVGFTGDASAMLGDVIADASDFTAAGAAFGGNVSAIGGADADITGSIAGNLSAVGSTLRASGGNPAVPGALAVGGNLTFDAASTYAANVFLTESAPGQRDSDRITAAGAASMDGKLIAVVDTDVSSGSIAPGRGETKTWRVISTAAGAGQFDVAKLLIVNPSTGSTRTIDLPINTSVDRGAVRYATAFDASGATITLTGLAAVDPDAVFATNCGTVTGAEINALVDRLDAIDAAGISDASTIAGQLLLFDYSQLPAAYAATGQQNPYAAADVILDAQFMGGQTAMLRLMQLRDGGMGRAAARSADAASGKAPPTSGAQAGPQPEFGAPLNGPTPDDGVRGWTRDYGFFESVDAQDCYACGYDAAIGSMMVGADWDVDGGGIIGVFGGAGPGRIRQDAPYGSQEEMVGNFQLGIYGSVVPGDGALYAQGYLLGGYDTIDRTRNVEIPGIQRTATSQNSAWTLSVGGEAGLNLGLGQRTFLQPYLGVSWGQYWGGGYTETGAESLNMTVQAQSANEWQPTAGARLMRALQSGTDVITPYIGAAFLAQLPVGDGWAPAWTSDFQLGEQQRLATAPMDRYGVSFQAGVEIATIKGMTAFVAFDGAVVTGKQRFGGQFGVVVPF
jgi:autotransporter-associated beta strand protein